MLELIFFLKKVVDMVSNYLVSEKVMDSNENL